MRRLALALLAVVLVSACGNEPPADSADARRPEPQAEPAERTQPVSRPAESAPPAPGQQDATRADTTGAPDTGRFVAGEHYRVLNPAQPTNVPPGKVEVVDVFWYGCGGCFALAPYIEAWQKSKPDVAEYLRLPATLNPGWQPQARLYYATKALGIEDETHSAIFREIHVERNPLNTMDAMVEFLGRFDVPEADARAALTGFSVDAELRAADVRARRYQLGFVPAVVVNGKYVVGVEQAGGQEAVIDVINHLVALESGAVEH